MNSKTSQHQLFTNLVNMLNKDVNLPKAIKHSIAPSGNIKHTNIPPFSHTSNHIVNNPIKNKKA